MALQQPIDQGLRELALFAGAGGGILGGHLLGWRCVCAVEIDAYARNVLIARQDDGCLPAFPIWDDIRTFDGRPWAGRVDVISGGFPCQDISVAGKGAGIDGERSGLWSEMARIVSEVRPRFVFVENSPLLVGRGLAVVLGDLAALGYDARWGVVGAHHAGAPHKRDRIWVLCWDANGYDANTLGSICERQNSKSSRIGKIAPNAQKVGWGARGLPERASAAESEPSKRVQNVANADGAGCQEQWGTLADGAEYAAAQRADWWESEPDVGGMVDGLAATLDIHGANAAGNVGRVATGIPRRVDRLRCLGNGQVPAAAALAWEILSQND